MYVFSSASNNLHLNFYHSYLYTIVFTNTNLMKCFFVRMDVHICIIGFLNYTQKWKTNSKPVSFK